MHLKTFFKYVSCTISFICILLVFFVVTQKDMHNEANLNEHIKLQRKVRDSTTKANKTYYYEEQQPVLVHAEHFMPTKEEQNDWAYNTERSYSYPTYYDYDQTADDYQRDDDYPRTDDYPDMNLQQRAQMYNSEEKRKEEQEEQQPQSGLNNILTIVKHMKTMWDLYQSITTAMFAKNPATEPSAIADKTERQKRGPDMPETKEASRYIKGDPLKGYYDFVITEGSYKFWAVFQLGTAILIIYSTFAAIYYSKVNPLVSDYDYTDYLGGARALTAADMDFEDTADEISSTQSSTKQAWYDNIMPNIGNTLKTVLETIDELPDVEKENIRYDVTKQKRFIAKNHKIKFT